MEKTKSKYYTIDDIPVEEYQCKRKSNGNWVLVIKHNEGVTWDSMKVFDSVKKRFRKFVYVEVDKFDGSDTNYLMLKDEDDNELHLAGCNAGYGGIGPNGTLKLLNTLGFNLDERFVFCARTFAIYHPKTGLLYP